jgi:hypothetical protein
VVGLELLLGLTITLPASADLLAPGQVIRAIPFELRDGDKPMVRATVAGRSGVMMVDNGTPDAVFLNRSALPLNDGRFVARGSAASGQAIEVRAHPAPPMQIAGQPCTPADTVRSGDFGFTASGLGDDFLGFIGTGMVEPLAFVLDHTRRHWVVMRPGADRSLPVAPPQHADIVVSVPFLIWPGEQPTIAASLGGWPVITDFDTGDGGTLYLTATTRERLAAQGLLMPEGDHWRLHGLTIGSVRFDPTPVRVVDAGSAQDVRTTGHADQLRLGAQFLAAHPCLWNFPAKTLTFLAPDAPFLRKLAAAAAGR